MDYYGTCPIDGYAIVGQLDEADMCYEWHTLTVFRRASDGRLFYVEESGCSCNGPLEDVSESDLVPVDHGSYWQDISGFPAKPDLKVPFFAMGCRSFGANVYVTSEGAFLA